MTRKCHPDRESVNLGRNTFRVVPARRDWVGMQKPAHPDDLDSACEQLLRLALRDELPEDLIVRRSLFRFWVESARLKREAPNAENAAPAREG